MEVDSEESDSDVSVKMEPCSDEDDEAEFSCKEQSNSDIPGIVLENIALKTEEYESDPELQMVIDEEAREFSKLMSSNAYVEPKATVTENDGVKYEEMLSKCLFRGAQNNYEKLLRQLQARLPEDEQLVASYTFVCDLCSKAFTKLQNFTLHVTALHKNTKLSIACEENETCRKIIASRIADSDVPPPLVPLKSKKVIKKTGEATSSGLEKREFVCHLCDKVYAHARSLRAHLAVKTFDCCGKTFQSCTDKQLHIRRNHCEAPDGKVSIMHCKCGVTFAHEQNLLIHQTYCQEHTSIVVFKCTICKAVFNTEFNLDNHLGTVHTVSSDQIVPYLKPKKCMLCDNLFVSSHNLHYCPYRQNKFNCEHCGQGFQTTLFLKVHKKALGGLAACARCKQYYTKCELPTHACQERCLTNAYLKSLENSTKVRVSITGDLVEIVDDPEDEGTGPIETMDDVEDAADYRVKLEEDMLDIVDNPVKIENDSGEPDANLNKLDPAKIDAIPKKVSANAVKIEIVNNPIKIENDSDDSDVNPYKLNVSPVQLNANPVKVGANSVKVGANTVKVGANTVEVGANPVKIFTKPINIAPKPIKVEPKPIQLTSNPVIITAHPIKIRANTVKTIPSPVKAAPKIAKISPTLVRIAPHPGNRVTNPIKKVTNPQPKKVPSYPIKIAPKPMTIVTTPLMLSTSPVKIAAQQIQINTNPGKKAANPVKIATSAMMIPNNALMKTENSVKSAANWVWPKDNPMVAIQNQIRTENDAAKTVSNIVKTESPLNTSLEVIEIHDSDEEPTQVEYKTASFDAPNKKDYHIEEMALAPGVRAINMPTEKLQPVILGKRKQRFSKKRIEWFEGPNENWDEEVEEEARYQREQEALRKKPKRRSKPRPNISLLWGKEYLGGLPRRFRVNLEPEKEKAESPPKPKSESSDSDTETDEVDIISYGKVGALVEPKREMSDSVESGSQSQPASPTDVVVKTERVEPTCKVVDVKAEIMPEVMVPIKSEKPVRGVAIAGKQGEGSGYGKAREQPKERNGGQISPLPKRRRRTCARTITPRVAERCGLQVYVCEQCWMSFLTPEHLKQHLAETHKIAENIDNQAHVDTQNKQELAEPNAATINLQSMRSKLSQKIAAYQLKAVEPSTSDVQGTSQSVFGELATTSSISIKEEYLDLSSDEAEEPTAIVEQEPDVEKADSNTDYEDDIIVLQVSNMQENEQSNINFDESNILEIAAVLKQKKLQQMSMAGNRNKNHTKSSNKHKVDKNESVTLEATNSNQNNYVTVVKCEPTEETDDSECLTDVAEADVANQISTAKDQLLMLDMSATKNRRRSRLVSNKRKRASPKGAQRNKISYTELKHRLKVPHRRHLREILKQCEKCTLKFPTIAFQRHVDECTADPEAVRSNVRKRDRLVMPQRSILKDYKRFKCASCHIVTYSFVNYCDHWKMHGYSENTCPVCKEHYDDKRKFAAHINKHMAQSYLQIYYIKDLKKSDPSNRYTRVCRMCKVQIQSSKVIQHWEEHVLNEHHMLKILLKRERVSKQTVTAPTRKLIDDNTIASIMQELLTETPKVNSERYYYGSTRIVVKNRRCLVCDKMFARPGDVKRHYVEHLIANSVIRRQELQTPDFPCDLCPLQTGSKFELKAHLREHAGLTQYNCHVCNKSFADSSNFAKHKKVHGLTAMVCDICGRKFNTRRMIEKHMLFHQTNSPLECPHCERAFFFPSALQKHVKMTHSTEAAIRCGYCDVVVRTHRQKWDHEWEAHGLRKFDADCPCCPKKFRTFSKIRQHLKNEHNIRFNKDDFPFVSPEKSKILSKNSFEDPTSEDA